MKIWIKIGIIEMSLDGSIDDLVAILSALLKVLPAGVWL